jgi:hypothetical protein
MNKREQNQKEATMKRFLLGETEYAWYKGDLYVVSESGDTLLPPYEGCFTFLETCAEDDAEKAAKVWESQK